jgi:surfeit locus 1 family protein
MGARMIEPLRQPNGDIVLVDLGWVPISRPGPIEQPDGAVTVTGYLRPGDTRHWWSVRDNPVERRFYTLDPQAIGEAVGQPNVLPYILVVLATSQLPSLGSSDDSEQVVKTWPAPATHLPRPPNSHLSYAITWYGLAAALLTIFIIWARKGPVA